MAADACDAGEEAAPIERDCQNLHSWLLSVRARLPLTSLPAFRWFISPRLSFLDALMMYLSKQTQNTSNKRPVSTVEHLRATELRQSSREVKYCFVMFDSLSLGDFNWWTFLYATTIRNRQKRTSADTACVQILCRCDRKSAGQANCTCAGVFRGTGLFPETLPYFLLNYEELAVLVRKSRLVAKCYSIAGYLARLVWRSRYICSAGPHR